MQKMLLEIINELALQNPKATAEDITNIESSVFLFVVF